MFLPSQVQLNAFASGSWEFLSGCAWGDKSTTDGWMIQPRTYHGTITQTRCDTTCTYVEVTYSAQHIGRYWLLEGFSQELQLPMDRLTAVYSACNQVACKKNLGGRTRVFPVYRCKWIPTLLYTCTQKQHCPEASPNFYYYWEEPQDKAKKRAYLIMLADVHDQLSKVLGITSTVLHCPVHQYFHTFSQINQIHSRCA